MSGVKSCAHRAKALEDAPGTVVEVNAECEVGEDVQRSNGCTAKTGHNVGVGVSVDEGWISPAPRQIGQMPQQERPTMMPLQRMVRAAQVTAT